MRSAGVASILALCLAVAACSAAETGETPGPRAVVGTSVGPTTAGSATPASTTSSSHVSQPPVSAPDRPESTTQSIDPPIIEPIQTTPTPDVVDPCLPRHPGAQDDSGALAPLAPHRYVNICLGMSFAEATTAMPGPTIAGLAQCPWYAYVLAADDPGLYVAAVSDPAVPGDAITKFAMTWTGGLARAASFPAPRTAEGISVGSLIADVRSAYPGAADVTVADPALGQRRQLVITGPLDTAMAFDVTEGRVSAIYWGTGVDHGSIAELCSL